MKGFNKIKQLLEKQPKVRSNFENFVDIQTNFNIMNDKTKLNQFYKMDEIQNKIALLPYEIDFIFFDK